MTVSFDLEGFVKVLVGIRGRFPANLKGSFPGVRPRQPIPGPLIAWHEDDVERGSKMNISDGNTSGFPNQEI